MTPSWSHQTHSIFRLKRFGLEEDVDWAGSIQDFLRLGFWKYIWSKLSQSLQNTRWRRQWLPHLTRIFSHWAKFLSLGTERSHTGPNPKNRVDEESIHSPIRSFVIATVDLWDDALSCWNLAWRGSKKSFEMSCHQMDYSAISWKFTKLIKRLTYVYIYKYVCAC